MGASSQTVAEHGIAGSDEEERASEREEDKVEHEKLPQLSPVLPGYPAGRAPAPAVSVVSTALIAGAALASSVSALSQPRAAPKRRNARRAQA